MPQLHISVPEEVAATIRREADAAGVTVSAYLARLVTRQIDAGYPEDFFEEVVGGWQGEPLEREPEGKLERRLALEPHGVPRARGKQRQSTRARR